MSEQLIDVNPDDLRKQAQQIESLANEYDAEYQNYLNAKDTLNGSVFSGAAAEAFKKKVEDFKDDFQRMSNRMKGYATYLRNSANEIENKIRERQIAAQNLPGQK